jgi:hypothetical protein
MKIITEPTVYLIAASDLTQKQIDASDAIVKKLKASPDILSATWRHTVGIGLNDPLVTVHFHMHFVSNGGKRCFFGMDIDATHLNDNKFCWFIASYMQDIVTKHILQNIKTGCEHDQQDLLVLRKVTHSLKRLLEEIGRDPHLVKIGDDLAQSIGQATEAKFIGISQLNQHGMTLQDENH